ncbi:tRNA modification GTPase MnmE [Rhynchospora pubera]|uniref:tRNA modification GTPase MnmE n=1 Tax=Rhynchospora pubera TaxID=906938 RepID=A0AAV8GIQ1_9POAL|nr:tRNA modification GTPase MnmE [Rhynchospora pubera]
MVVSIPFSHIFPSRLSKLPFLFSPSIPPHLFLLPKSKFKPKTKHKCLVTAQSINGASSSNSSTSPDRIRTLFPGGFKRPEVGVPAIVLRVSVDEVASQIGAVSEAVSRGVGIVVLEGGDQSGGRVYDAACALKPVVADRAYFLIAERVDVASAIGATGVVLQDDGIPTIVARNMMMQSKSDSIYLPLVARVVQNIDSAKNASSSEGADFLIIKAKSDNISRVLQDSMSVKVPIFFTLTDLPHEESPPVVASKLLDSGASGVVASLAEMELFTENIFEKVLKRSHDVDKHLQDGRLFSGDLESTASQVAGFTKLGEMEVELIERERALLEETAALIRKAVPTMEEVSLLVDAISRLSEPFLLVIVGEFNSGKSTVINALLGRRYLKDGVVPTTNEITLLCYSDIGSIEQERCERHPDGQFICYISVPMLKEMNLVDTPGTNVILQRQQRLTEEFVPRADLILFILSADRPLTESEVAFLQYVQQWKKKVVFILNKMDIYRSTSELEEAISFVKENTKRLLNAEEVIIFPISARSALEAKLSLPVPDQIKNHQLLTNNPQWGSSKFEDFESYLLSFMDGSTNNGKERIRLKMETPVGIADRLLSSCELFVKVELENAIKDLKSIDDLVASVKEYGLKVEAESISWKKQILSLVEKAKTRAVNLMESILQLSNLDLISIYTFRGEKSSSSPATSSVQNEILVPTLSEVQSLLGEYSRWLHSSNTEEATRYLDIFQKRWESLLEVREMVWSDPRAIVRSDEELSVKVLESFNASSAARVFEKEIREVALGTFGGLGAAGLSASLLTSVLSTTLDDLLALAFCSAGGFLVISNFPGRRREASEKIEKVANALAQEVEQAMKNDLIQSTEKLAQFVKSISKPYRDAARQKIERLELTQAELTSMGQKLQNLKVEIQNIHAL